MSKSKNSSKNLLAGLILAVVAAFIFLPKIFDQSPKDVAGASAWIARGDGFRKQVMRASKSAQVVVAAEVVAYFESAPVDGPGEKLLVIMVYRQDGQNLRAHVEKIAEGYSTGTQTYQSSADRSVAHLADYALSNWDDRTDDDDEGDGESDERDDGGN